MQVVMPNMENILSSTVFRVLALIVGAMSVVSFTLRIIDFGLLPVAQNLVDYYREISHFVFAKPFEFFGRSIPKYLPDAWALSFVGAAAYVSTPNIENSRFFRSRHRLTNTPQWKLYLFVVFGVTGLGLFVLLGAASPTTYIDEMHNEPLNLSKGAARNALYIIGLALLFFVINAFAPNA